jgi:hypothetical protein
MRFLTVLILAFGFMSGVSASAADDIKIKGGSKVLATEGGRYVLGQISDARRDQYLLDTKTGRLWEVIEYTSRSKTDESKTETRTMLRPVRFLDKLQNESVEPIPEK